ncbi:MAG: hypothetical protein QOH23_2016, partial [Gaiellaceae bacterium]|nr:hypothetical protein [Gaiellaceae bacterium]
VAWAWYGGERKGTAAVASWTRGDSRADRIARCLACGGRMEPALRAAGSLRCLDCRELGRALDPLLVESRRQAKTLGDLLGRRLFG